MSHLGQSKRTTSREGVQWSYVVPKPKQKRVFEGLGTQQGCKHRYVPCNMCAGNALDRELRKLLMQDRFPRWIPMTNRVAYDIFARDRTDSVPCARHSRRRTNIFGQRCCQSESPMNPPRSSLEVCLRLQLETTCRGAYKSHRGRRSFSLS